MRKSLAWRMVRRVLDIGALVFVGYCLWNDCFPLPWLRRLFIMFLVGSFILDELSGMVDIWFAALKERRREARQEAGPCDS